MIKVLVVDDSALMRRVLSGILQAAGDFEVSVARDGAEALIRLHEFQPDVITMDVNMPGMDGLACLDRVMVERPCPVVMLSSLTTAGTDVTLAALRLGAVDFIVKPGGTISLAADELAVIVVRTLRNAASARVPAAHRLAERVRLRTGIRTGIARPPTARPAVPLAGRAGAGAANLPPCPAGDGIAVVLVGTSTGGPPALDALLAPLPAEFPYPVVVAQHMPAAFTAALARRLDTICALQVLEVTDATDLRPGCVYIAKGDADIVIGSTRGGLFAAPAAASTEHRWHPSVDRLVASAMTHVGAARLIGVLMTGMGNDGAAAMTRLHHEGGRTIAESADTAVIWGMPGELVKAGGATVVTRVDEIASQLQAWAK